MSRRCKNRNRRARRASKKVACEGVADASGGGAYEDPWSGGHCSCRVYRFLIRTYRFNSFPVIDAFENNERQFCYFFPLL
jgi:hypothetical protein